MSAAPRSLAERVSARAELWHRSARLLRHHPAVRLHRRLGDLTMVPRTQFVENIEIARTARTVSGDLVECGVWRGGMSAALAHVLPNRTSVLFDSFEGLPDAKQVDGPAAVHWSTSIRDHDNCTADEESAHRAMTRLGKPSYEVRPGWFDETVPAYATLRRPIAVLRLDGDWYDSTLVCLTHLFPLVQPGGVVLVDDYFDWDGCSRAVHDYLSGIDASERVRTSRYDEFAFIIKNGAAIPFAD